MKHLTMLVALSVSLLFGSFSSIAGATDVQNSVEFLNSKPSTLPFSEAVKVNGTLYLSGQIGFDGKSGKLVQGGVAAETHQTLKNIKQALNNHGYQMKDVVKCMVMLADIKDFPQFNQIYKQYFLAPYPARSTFAVAGLALNAQIEIECMAAK